MSTTNDRIEDGMANLKLKLQRLTAEIVRVSTALDWDNDERGQLIEESGLLSVLESEWTCVICEGIFIDPATLICGHTFCAHCLCQWHSKKKDCPTCREPCEGAKPKKNVSMSAMIEQTYSVLITREDLRKLRAEALKEREVEVEKAVAAEILPQIPEDIPLEYEEEEEEDPFVRLLEGEGELGIMTLRSFSLDISSINLTFGEALEFDDEDINWIDI